MVGPPITGQLTLEGIPVLGLVDTGASVTCLGFDIWWRYRAQWGPLRQFEGTVHGAHGKPLQIAGPPMGRGPQSGLFYSNCGPRIAAMYHRDGYHEATPRPY